LCGQWGPRKLSGITDPAKYKLHQSLTIFGIDLHEFNTYALAGNQVANLRLNL